MIAVIDNYDSFTYNLVQYLGELGAETRVYRNNRITLDDLIAQQPTHLVVSPGPGSPEKDAGVSNAAIRHFHGRIPVLGVCLGHQCIGHVFGAHVGSAPRLMHGKTSRITHFGDSLFAGVPTTFEATRYHSLIVYDPLPPDLQAIARTADGEIMAVTHREGATYGLQFHPESILTPDGKRLLSNFLHMNGARGVSQAADQALAAAITLPTAIERALGREHLTLEEAEAVMTRIMSGEATPAQIGGYLAALRAKGETVPEITGFARAMRRHATTVRTTRRPLVDTCGTGGDGAGTFNISTTAAFVVAGAGVAVAKHGNRSVSSRSGSADVFVALGAKVDISPEAMGRCIDEVGIGFLFAPRLHPAMKHAMGPRREMGVRTVFNILGPLTNPAGAPLQVMGVFDRTLVEPLAHVLNGLGSEAAYVVHSSDGLDELSTGVNYVAVLRAGHVAYRQMDGREYDLQPAPPAALLGGTAEENAIITRRILAGERGPRRDVVLLNAAAALHVASVAADMRSGMAMAAHSIDSGEAQRMLDRLVAFTQEAA